MHLQGLLINLGHRDPCACPQLVQSHDMDKVLTLEPLELDILTSESELEIWVPLVHKFDISCFMLWVLSIVTVSIAPHLW